jgi:uncharacterized protein
MGKGYIASGLMLVVLLSCSSPSTRTPHVTTTRPAPQRVETAAITNAVPYAAKPFALSNVRVTGGPLKVAQDKTAEYLLSLEVDRMMFYLRQRAGLEPKAEQAYSGWDGAGRQLTGHIAGHYLSAVSLMYAATGDERFKQRADYLVDELKQVQDKHGDGYIGALMGSEGRGRGGGGGGGAATRTATTRGAEQRFVDGKTLFEQLRDGTIRSSGFDLNGMWAPWYVQHKLFAGLRDAYRITGNKAALDVETKFAGWVESVIGKLDESQVQRMLGTEFGAMNEVLLDLYADTGDARWLELSKRFYHKAFVDPLANQEDILPRKHGNTNVPKLYGELMRNVYTGDTTSGNAAKFFWQRVVNHHSFATGGHGRNEYFGQPDQLNSMVDGRTAESCNIYNMAKFTRTLFALDPQMAYADFLERALFNHILASIDPETGRTCYMVPVGRGVQHEYANMMQSFTCCVGTGMESHALHGDGIYYQSDGKLWVNLFAPSTAEWKSAGVQIKQETEFPEGESAKLTVTTSSPKQWTMLVRRPWWAGEGFAMKVNGQAISALPSPGAYVEINRTWNSGDLVELTLPKKLHSEPLPDNKGRMALMWGPLVLAGDLGPETRGGGRRGGGGGGATTAASNRPRQAQAAVPVFITAATVDQWLKPVAGKTGTFKTDGVGKDQDVEFVPFYRLHQRRYGVYWDVFTPQAWAAKQTEFEAEQAKMRKLEAATVAFAQPGEMQPERDFNYQGEDAETTRVNERPGRRGGQWFSFDLPVEPARPMKLLVTYSNDEREIRNFEILIDGQKLADQSLQRRPSPEQEVKLTDVEYDVPAAMVQGKQKVTVKFQPKDDSSIGGVFGVRMIRGDAER